ncbi:MAG: apolipoprotein N-acyltransferase [Candidatus Omnitrophica bacterium]|nr:apolipoprotein N-acyltransferase [Candidatus Omnitrophota bacterium]
MKKNILINISLSILSAILTFLAFPPFELSFLAWISLVPLLFVAKRCSPKEAVLYSYFSGVVFFSLLLYWLVNVTVPGLIVLVFLLSIVYGLFGGLSACVFKYSMTFFILPFSWALLEYIRGNLLTGFSWGLLSYSQYKAIKLIQIADFAGAYGVSFVIVVFNIALFSLIIRDKRRVVYSIAAVAFIAMAVVYGTFKFKEYPVRANPKISVIQGNVPQEYKWDPAFSGSIVGTYSKLTEKAAAGKPDMIVWPETSYPYLVDTIDKAAEEVGELALELKTPILAGVVFKEGDDYYNSAFLFDKEGGVSGIYSKVHLVPFGEYIPWAEYLSFLRDHIDKPIGEFRAGEDYNLLTLRSQTRQMNFSDDTRTRQTVFYKFGVLICFEDVFPYITREFVRSGADFIVNITNDAWFGETAAPVQHLQASVFRAVENRVPVIRVANTGISCFVDSTGEVLSSVELEGKRIFVGGFATASVNVYDGQTLYTAFGDIFILICFIMFIFLLIIEGYLPKSKQ